MTRIKKSLRSTRIGVIAGLVVFVFLFVLTGSYIYQRYKLNITEHKNEALTIGSQIKSRIQESFSNNLLATKLLTIFINSSEGYDGFDSMASPLVHSSNDVDELQLIRDGEILKAYPSRSDHIVASEVLKNALLHDFASPTATRNQNPFIGPFMWDQGEPAIASYHPIYLNKKFWGIAAGITKVKTILSNAGIDSGGLKGYYVNLEAKENNSTSPTIILSSPENGPHTETFVIKVPNGQWVMNIIPRYRYMNALDVSILGFLALLFSLLAGYITFHVIMRPERLRKLVKERTQQLIDSEEDYRILFEKNPLPLWIYDMTSLRFMAVNEAAKALYGFSDEEFGTMTVLDIRTEEEKGRFLNRNTKYPEDELHDAGTWTHVKKNREAIQVMIFSRKIDYRGKDSRLVLLMDMTSKVKIERELILSEEKYRLLIEQASDVIILYSFNGTVLSYNKSAYEQTGYTAEEFAKLNLHQLFVYNKPVPGRVEADPFSVKGRTTLYRWMKRKDGSEFIVELNARMLEDGNIHAIIRGVTEREIIQEKLRRSEERFSRFFHSSTMVFSIVDDNARIVDVNESYRKLFALNQDIIGKTSEEAGMLAHATPGTMETHQRRLRHLMDTVGRVDNYELDVIDENGISKTILFTMEPIVMNDEKHWLMSAVDITKERQRDEQIRSFNERFSMIANATNEVIWDHDFASNVTWGNNRLYELYGIEPGSEKITMEKFVNNLHPEDGERILERMYAAIDRKDKNITEVVRVKMPDGAYRIFRDRATFKYDEDGKALRILGAMHDITEEEQMKDQLVREKELADSIINSLPGIFYIFDSDLKFIKWNENLVAISGYSAEELLTLHPYDMVPKEQTEYVTQSCRAGLKGEYQQVEIEMITKQGKEISYYFNGIPIIYEGKQCVVGIGFDLTEQRKAQSAIVESEERYRSLVDNATEVLMLYNVDSHTFVNVSDSAAKMFKCEKEELLHIGFSNISSSIQSNGDTFNTFKKKLQQVLDGEKLNFEWNYKNFEGTIIPCETSLVRLPGPKVLIRASINDISERKKYEEELKRSSEQLRELYHSLQNVREEERKHIAREIHDELGQQLTSLKMDIFWINRRIKSEDANVDAKINDILSLIDETINTVRKIATELRPSILDDLGLIPALEWQIEEFEKHTSVPVNLNNAVGDIAVDPDTSIALFRIFQEILTNIGRHAAATQVDVHVFIDGSKLFLIVRDNGIGFNPQVIAQRNTLGLTGIKERCELIGGTYEVRSEKGKGTEIEVSAPIYNDNE